MAYDLLIKNGRIVDGSGMPAFRGDVGIKNGKIAEIGKLSGPAKTSTKTIAIITVWQVFLGIATLLMQAPELLAAAHNAVINDCRSVSPMPPVFRVKSSSNWSTISSRRPASPLGDGGPLAFASGVTLRKEAIDLRPSAAYQSGDVSGYGAAVLPFAASRTALVATTSVRFAPS